jgi:hypothetical protein
MPDWWSFLIPAEQPVGESANVARLLNVLFAHLYLLGNVLVTIVSGLFWDVCKLLPVQLAFAISQILLCDWQIKCASLE